MAALDDLHRIGIKILCADGPTARVTEVVPVFHRWVRDGAMPEHLLIDIGDYEHVPDGPGVVLIGHEGNFGLDEMGGRRGFVYYRKQPFADGDLTARLHACALTVLRACRMIERDESLAGRFRFAGGSLELFANDRLRAPNAPETYDAFAPALTALTRTLYGDAPCTIERPQDPRSRFGVRITGPETSVDQLLSRLA